MRRYVLLLLALLIACAGPSVLDVSPEWQRALVAALATERAGDPAGARAQLEAIAAAQPQYTEAQVALDRLVGRLDGDEARKTRAEALALDPRTRPIGLLLLADHAEPEDREALLREALALRPGMIRARVGLARLARKAGDFEGALELLDDVLDDAPDDVEALVESAYCYFRTFKWPEARAAAGRAARLDPTEPRALVFGAVDRLIRRDFAGAIVRFRELRSLAPDPDSARARRSVSLLAYRGRLARLRADRDLVNGLPLAAEAAAVFPDSGLMRDMLGFFTELAGDRGSAETHYRAALDTDAYSLRPMQDLRRVLFARGQFREAVAIWRKLVPMRLVLRPDNELRPRWLRLLRAVRATPSAEGADRDALIELAQAASAVGWLEESIAVYEGVLPAAEEAAEVVAVWRFLQDWRARVRVHYRALERKEDTIGLEGLAAWLRANWPGSIPGPRPELEIDLETYYVLVREVTPFRRLPGSLAQALDRYGLFFDAGDNAGELDVRVARMLFRGRCEQRVSELPYSYTALVIDETLIDNYLAYLSGNPRVSGRCFLSRRGFYVALDTFRPSARVVRGFLDRPTGPERPESARVAYSASLDAALRARFLGRLGVDYPLEKPDAALVDRVYRGYLHAFARNVWMHELGHLVDFEKYVPFGERLGANIAVTLRCGLSPSKIVGRFERVAETFSLATTPYPYLCLQDNLDRLELDPSTLFYMVLVAWQKRDPRESPYYLGARAIFEALVADAGELEDIGAMSAARIRRIAREQCADEGIPFELGD